MNILRLSTLSLTLAIAVMTLGYVDPASAAPKDVNCDDPKEQHPSCKDKDGETDGGRDETFYDVVIGPATTNGSAIDGESDLEHPWLTFGKGTSIGLGDATLSPPGDQRPGIGEFTDLSFFSSSAGNPFFTEDDDGNPINQGIICFPKEGDLEHKDHDHSDYRGAGSFSIHQGRVQRAKGGRAQASFWFDGFTHTKVKVEDGDDELVKVLYALQLTGDLVPDPWPPETTTTISMTAWELSATNEGKAIKKISCIGKGGGNVDIMVTGPVDEI